MDILARISQRNLPHQLRTMKNQYANYGIKEKGYWQLPNPEMKQKEMPCQNRFPALEITQEEEDISKGRTPPPPLWIREENPIKWKC